VEWVCKQVPGAGCWVLGAVLGAGCLVQGAVLSAQAAQRPALPALPLTQLDDRAMAADLDNRTFTLTFAQPVPVRDLLLLLVRGTSLSIVPDPAIEGTFIGELKNVTVRQALNLILPPLGLASDLDGAFIRVFKREPETRLYDLAYAAAERAGTSSVATSAGGSSASVATSTTTHVFDDITAGVRSLLSARATFNVDRKAGLLQVTDFPERLDRVAIYLDAVSDRVHRQVQIDARLIEVEPNEANASGIDWAVVAAQLAGASSPGAPPRPSLTGLRVTDVPRLLTLLGAQGKVTSTDVPRLLTMNNEPVLVSTDAIALSITPQISPDGVITMAVSPIVKAPATGQADLIARVADGETLVLPGFTRTREVKEKKVIGSNTAGGWFGRGTVVTQKKMEMMILLTPRIVSGVGVQ
jgi:type II secretory pathway component GspD/PulD (secretin)